MGGVWVVYVWLGQISVSINTMNLERVLYVCPALDWRWSDVLLASTFTRGKTLTFSSMQEMCADVDAHKKWMTFIRRSRQIINEFWRTPSESQRTNRNSSFFVRWTCVMICVTGPLSHLYPRYTNASPIHTRCRTDAACSNDGPVSETLIQHWDKIEPELGQLIVLARGQLLGAWSRWLPHI